MRKRKLIYALCLATSMSAITGCSAITSLLPNNDSEEVVQNIEVEPTQAPVVNEPVVEDSPKAEQQITVMINIDELDEEETVELPFDEFNKYGKVVKTKDGYRVLGQDGKYITESVLNVGEHCFYFDETGLLKNDVFVPAQNVNGDLITLYIHNYSYMYGLIKTPDGSVYYIDEDLGRFENTTKEIDGQMYYFNDEGKSVSEKTFNKMYVSEKELEVPIDLPVVDGEWSTITVSDLAVELGETLANSELYNTKFGPATKHEDIFGLETIDYPGVTFVGFEVESEVAPLFEVKVNTKVYTIDESYMNMSLDDWNSLLGEAIKKIENEGSVTYYWNTDEACINATFNDDGITDIVVTNKQALLNSIGMAGFNDEQITKLYDAYINYASGANEITKYNDLYTKISTEILLSQKIEETETDVEEVEVEETEVAETEAE